MLFRSPPPSLRYDGATSVREEILIDDSDSQGSKRLRPTAPNQDSSSFSWLSSSYDEEFPPLGTSINSKKEENKSQAAKKNFHKKKTHKHDTALNDGIMKNDSCNENSQNRKAGKRKSKIQEKPSKVGKSCETHDKTSSKKSKVEGDIYFTGDNEDIETLSMLREHSYAKHIETSSHAKHIKTSSHVLFPDLHKEILMGPSVLCFCCKKTFIPQTAYIILKYMMKEV